MGKGLEGRNSFGQTLWSLHPVWVQGCGHRKGTERGKPAKAGHCSAGPDPTPGARGHSVPNMLSQTSIAQEQEADQGVASPELHSWSPHTCLPTICLLIMLFTQRGCSQY